MISRPKYRLLLLSILAISFSATVLGTQRDHLTPQEVDLVKEAQILDKRIEVFIKAADRRLLVLNGKPTDAASAKQLKKDSETWGELPTGTRAELVGDIAHIFDEAITNIDDVSSRDERNPLISKALRKLAAAVNRIVAQLGAVRTQAKSEAEVASFGLLDEDAQSILEAVNKLPPEVEKKSKGKNDKAKDKN